MNKISGTIKDVIGVQTFRDTHKFKLEFCKQMVGFYYIGYKASKMYDIHLEYTLVLIIITQVMR